jgi:hypothetical protein
MVIWMKMNIKLFMCKHINFVLEAVVQGQKAGFAELKVA